MKTTGNTILITGGGSGIGAVLAHAFHALGNQVIITGRREHALSEMLRTHPGMAAYPLDVRDIPALETFAAMLVVDYPQLNVVINNAGVMRTEDLRAGTAGLGAFEDMLQTNVVAPVRLTGALIPHFLQQPAATIVNVGSGLAHVPLAAVPNYSASKAAIHAYTLALRHQLAGSPVEVLEIIPPAVHTGLLGSDQPAPHEMPLPDFIAELMALFTQQPTPAELCVANVLPLRHAEASGNFDAVFGMVNHAIAL
jgi:uncharacterized oxidoreductase